MTAPTTRAKPKIALDQRAASRHDGAIGLGDRFDGDKVKAYPPGSVIILPGDTPHFHWAKSGEYVTQVTAIGPLGLECMDPNDDPRQQNR